MEFEPVGQHCYKQPAVTNELPSSLLAIFLNNNSNNLIVTIICRRYHRASINKNFDTTAVDSFSSSVS